MGRPASWMSSVSPHIRWWVALGAGVLISACSGETPLAIRQPELALLPTSLDFGEVVAGEETGTLTFNVENAGTAELRGALVLAGADPAAFALPDPVDIVLDGGDSVEVPVTFSPDALRDFDASVVVAWNDPEEPAQDGVVTLAGTGREPRVPDIDVQPSCVTFLGVPVGRSSQSYFDLENDGEAPLHVGSVIQSGSGAFRVANDPSGVVVEPGRRTQVLVEYAPVAADQGDSGLLIIPSDDPDEPEITVCFEGNGGGDQPYPVAVIDCPGTIDIVGAAEIALDGSKSYDPKGATPLTYAWSIVRRPDAADPDLELVPTDASTTTLSIDAAGTWEVSLTVSADRAGAQYVSVPEKCVIEAVPQDGVYVELTWSGPTSDFDLHLAENGADFYAVPGDCSWCNENPDWGVSGQSLDDPVFGPDVDDGFGPEYVTIEEPADGTYLVRAHHFDDGNDGRTTATVQVFLAGTLAWSGSKPLERNEVWDVGQINWADGNFGAFTAPPWDAGGIRECR